jgi:hypothetical protein
MKKLNLWEGICDERMFFNENLQVAIFTDKAKIITSHEKQFVLPIGKYKSKCSSSSPMEQFSLG